MSLWKVTWWDNGQVYCTLVRCELYDITSSNSRAFEGIGRRPENWNILKIERAEQPLVNIARPS